MVIGTVLRQTTCGHKYTPRLDDYVVIGTLLEYTKMWSWHTNKINVVTGTLLRYNGQQDRYVIGKQYCGHRHVDTKAKCLILKTKR